MYNVLPGVNVNSKHFILSKSAIYFGCGVQGLTGDLNSKFS